MFLILLKPLMAHLEHGFIIEGESESRVIFQNIDLNVFGKLRSAGVYTTATATTGVRRRRTESL